MRVIIFEQNQLIEEQSDFLDRAWIEQFFAWDLEDDYHIVLEAEDERAIVYQAFNSDGESWKFIGIK